MPADDDRDASNHVEAPPALRQVSDKVARKFELVPAIGERWTRWYDAPYRLLNWLLQTPQRRFIPWRLRRRLNNASNFLLSFDQVARDRVAPLDDPHDNLIVPADETLTCPAIWAIELFPPSTSAALLKVLRQNGWGRSLWVSLEGSIDEQITRARRAGGQGWLRLGAVVNPKTPSWDFDVKRQTLPDHFGGVEITAVQIGPSLTAIIARAILSESGSAALNTVWHATHEPTIDLRGLNRPTVESRYFAAIQATQRARLGLQNELRSWMTQNFPGFFSQSRDGQPILEMQVFSKYNPLEEANRSMVDPLRALGLQIGVLRTFVSDRFRGSVLAPSEILRHSEKQLLNSWSVVGQLDLLRQQLDTEGYGSKPYSFETLAHIVNDEARAFLVYFGIERYSRQLVANTSEAMDNARRKHSSFAPKEIERLRRELLSTSLDLPAASRDSALPWSDQWPAELGFDLRTENFPDPPFELDSIDLLARWGEARTERFTGLLADDATYRSVLTAASSLGSNAASARLGRRALAVSATSLAVALTALMLANEGSVGRAVISWLSNL